MFGKKGPARDAKMFDEWMERKRLTFFRVNGEGERECFFLPGALLGLGPALIGPLIPIYYSGRVCIII